MQGVRRQEELLIVIALAHPMMCTRYDGCYAGSRHPNVHTDERNVFGVAHHENVCELCAPLISSDIAVVVASTMSL
jgi:hypothetical protein